MHDVAHPFRFGVTSTGRPSGREWRDFARELEQLGYHTLQVPQHFSMRSAPPLPALALAAAATETLSVGTLVLDNGVAHPALVARDAAWLAAATEGRFELGIGAGWLAEDYRVLGEPWRPAGERVSRLDEALALIRACWADEPTTFEGTYYRVDGLANGTATTNPPPILVAGGGPRVLGVAARHADIVGIAPDMRTGRIGRASARTMGRAHVIEKSERVRQEASDRFPAGIELQITLTGVYGWDDPRLGRAAEAFGVDIPELVEVPSVLVGSTSEMVEQLLRLREGTAISYVSAHESVVRRLAPVVAELRGR